VFARTASDALTFAEVISSVFTPLIVQVGILEGGLDAQILTGELDSTVLAGGMAVALIE
jgi:hypothetical protein